MNLFLGWRGAVYMQLLILIESLFSSNSMGARYIIPKANVLEEGEFGSAES